MASSHSTGDTPARIVCPDCHFERTHIRSLPPSVQDQTCPAHVAAYFAELRQRASAKADARAALEALEAVEEATAALTLRALA